MARQGTSRQEYRRARRRFFDQDPHCHWCGTETIWVEVNLPKPPPTMATLDHLSSRFDKYFSKNAVSNTVLACYDCNQRRGREREAEVPTEVKFERQRNGKRWKKQSAPSDWIESAYFAVGVEGRDQAFDDCPGLWLIDRRLWRQLVYAPLQPSCGGMAE